MLRNLSSLILPTAILLASGVLLSRAPGLPASQQELLSIAPYLLALVAIASAYHFRRGRACLVLLISTSAYYFSSTYGASDLSTPQAVLIHKAFAVLLSFNLLVITLMSEKGSISPAGRMRLMFVFAQLLLFWFTFKQNSQTIWITLTRPILQNHLLEQLRIPQISFLFLLAATLLTLRRIWQRPSPLDGAFLGVVSAVWVILSNPSVPHLEAIYYSAISLIFILAIIQDSHNMAFRDDMTGLPSRRALNELLRSLGNRYTIAMVDVDHFKRFNDTHGHDVGDQVLKMVAARLMSVSGGGRPFRYGGEEFTVVFSGKTSVEAAPHLEKLRLAIADYKLALRADERPQNDKQGQGNRIRHSSAREVSVTVSIGAAESSGRYATPEEVIKAADTALYRAKNGGRNQVCLDGRR